MSQATAVLFTCGQYGTTPDGDFWRSRCGTVLTLYNERYPHGSVAVNVQGTVVLTDDGMERRELQAEVQAHYTKALEAIAAGNVQEHHQPAGPEEVDSRETTTRTREVAPAGSPPDTERRHRSM